MDVGELVSRLISLGMMLATAGILIQVCTALKKEALETNQTGLISLRQWNRSLERGR